MPYVDDNDPGWNKVQERLAEALASFAPDLGARECEHGDWALCDSNDGAGCKFGDTRPKSDSMAVITDFVLVAVVADMGNSGAHDICCCASPGMRNHNTKGLLHVALYE